MSYAIGSKSKLNWTEETSFGVSPSGNVWKSLLFSSESFVENINKIQSEDIRPDRTQPSIRAGNIACGGSVSSDFALSRFGIWLKHLLCTTSTDSTITIYPAGSASIATGFASATAIVRGQPFSSDASGSTGLFVATNNFTLNATGATTEGQFQADVTGAVAGQTVTLVTSSVSGLGQVLCIVPRGTATPTYYKHVLTGGVTKPTGGLCIEKQVLGGSTPYYAAFRGSRVNSLSLSFAQQAIVKAQWSLLNIDTVVSTSTSVDATGTGYTSPTDDPFTGYDAFISLNNGTSYRPLRDLTLDINNNFDENIYTLNSQFRQEITEGKRMITGRLSTFWDTITEYNLFKNQTTFDANISVVHGNGVFIIDLPENRLTGAGTPQIGGQGVITAQFDMSTFHQAGSYDISITIYDLNASIV